MHSPTTPHSKGLSLLFALTLFFSASLMFLVQPMFGKILLPLLGGTPAVWNTCMVFYQSLLFLGYAYAHLLGTKLHKSKQILVHGALLLGSLLFLPVGLSAQVTPPSDSDPTLWIIGNLFVAIGVPFFTVATTAPLLQKWFAQTEHETRDDPYYLYAASNAGSLLSLLLYPFVIEPHIGLSHQQSSWSFAYGGLVLAILMCALSFWKNSPHAISIDEADDDEVNTELKPAMQIHWLLLALVPSSLLLGLTNFISTDIASVPLLWIIPLILYLLSFVLVFSKWGAILHPWMLQIQPAVLLPFLAFSFINPAVIPYWLDLILHSLSFFIAIMVCHGELARLRPETRFLTRFYLIMSFAGMLGGMFNTFVAPFIFNGVYEYPIMIVAALLLRPGLQFVFPDLIKQAILPILLLIAGIITLNLNEALMDSLDAIGVVLLVLSGLLYSFKQQTFQLAALSGIIIGFTLLLHQKLSDTLFQERSFFGVLSARATVIPDEHQQPETVHELYHGTTKHGAQRLAAALQTTPLTYYSRPGPIGQLFADYDSINQNWHIASVGLGAGALACYAKNTQQWTFYEIDPLVVSTAKDTRYFTYLSRCTPQATIKTGDARLSLDQEVDQSFDLLILDAFSSDAIPTHLLTKEALQLYFAKLKPDGMLAFHITNRHLAVKKVLSQLAKELNLSGLIQEFQPTEEQPLIVATDWVVLSNNAAVLAPLTASGRWQKLPLYFDNKTWTDDFSNIISIWK